MRIRKIIAWLLTLTMIIVLVPTSRTEVEAASPASVVVIGQEDVVPGSTVTVDVSIKNNPGILGAVLKLEYDSNLTLKEIQAGDAFSSLTLTKPGKLVSGCKLVWDGQEVQSDDIKDGIIISLTFDVSETAEAGAELPINISFEDAVDKDLNAVEIVVADGKICLQKEKAPVTVSFITAEKKLTTYEVGDVLNVDDIKVSAVYSDETSKEVTEFKTNVESIDMQEEGEKELVVSYEENDIIVTSVIVIQVLPKKNTVQVLELQECEVSPQVAKAGDVVTWTLRFNEGCTPWCLNLEYPNGYTTELQNWTLEADGRYSCSYTVPEFGYNGTYIIPSVAFQRDEDADSGVVYLIYSSDSSESDNAIDLSSLYVEVEGLLADEEPPTYDISNIVTSIEEGLIKIYVPMEDALSGIKEIFLGLSCFDETENRWKSAYYGFFFDLEDMKKVDNGYEVAYNLEDFVTYNGDGTYGVGVIAIWDMAGNSVTQVIMPGYPTWDQEEEQIGLDVIPKNLRFVIEDDNSESNPGGSTEEKPNDNPGGSTEEKPNDNLGDSTEENPEDKSTTEQPTTEKTLPTVGTKVTISVGQYKITKSSSKTKEVTFVKPKSNKKTSVTIPATVKIDGYTYKVTEIVAKAFKNNKYVKSVTIGNNVKKIGNEAFSGCKNLKKVTIGNKVTTIGKNAFYNCKKLNTITIKSSVLKSVGNNAIKNIDKKATIKVPKKQLSKYKKLFKSKTGYKKTMKIKK